MGQVTRYTPALSNWTSCDSPGWIVNPWPVRGCGPVALVSQFPSFPRQRTCVAPPCSATKWMLPPAVILRLVWTKLDRPMSTSLAGAFDVAPPPPHAARASVRIKSSSGKTSVVFFRLPCIDVLLHGRSSALRYPALPNRGDQRRELSSNGRTLSSPDAGGSPAQPPARDWRARQAALARWRRHTRATA